MIIIEFFTQEDKLLHITVSLILFIFIIILRKYFLKNEWDIRIVAFSIRDVLIIWILKELVDSLWFWNPQFWDMIANSLWIIIPIYLYYTVKESKKIEETNFIKYEKYLINEFKKRIITQINRIKLTKNQDNKVRMIALYEIYTISKYTTLLSLVWIINLIILIIDIPFMAFYDLIKFIINFITIPFNKVKV